MEETDVIVVGSGLAGSMTCLLLAKRGFRVIVLERAKDPRVVHSDKSAESEAGYGTTKNALKRSINLALSTRGEAALAKAGVLEDVMKFSIPMPRRVIHNENGKISFQPYGTADQAIKSIGRETLNVALLEKAAKLDKLVKLIFECEVLNVGKDASVTFKKGGKESTIKSQLVIGADGAYSTVREFMMKHYRRADFTRSYISHCYKELNIPPTKNNEFALENYNGLHIWPRGDFMLIALPNPDKSFTVTLFAPEKQFASLEDEKEDAKENEARVKSFFTTNFPDIVPLIPDLQQDFKSNPTGPLVSITVNPWNYKDKILILGDAAHACVPFYGQGMNAAFEDALVLDECVESCQLNLSRSVEAFAQQRRKDGDAIAKLSFDNYAEMASHTGSTLFLLRKKFEGFLHYLSPSGWIPQYTMVAFTRIPYSKVIERSNRQDLILERASLMFALGLTSAVAFLGYQYGYKHYKARSS